MPSSARLTRSASVRLDALLAAGHSVHWGRATDGRIAFYWARVTPSRSASVRNARAADSDSLMAKVQQVADADPSSHVVESFSDPLRYCERCKTELSFDAESDAVFSCPLKTSGAGHTEIVPI